MEVTISLKLACFGEALILFTVFVVSIIKALIGPETLAHAAASEVDDYRQLDQGKPLSFTDRTMVLVPSLFAFD